MICDTCEYAGRPSYAYPCSKCDMKEWSQLCMYSKKIIYTNADRIKSMNNEELAHFLLMEVVNGKCYGICHGSCTGHDCISGIVKWLNSEFQED